MKEILINNDNLSTDEIDEIVTRTKGLIINDNDEIILGYSNKVYQFPGGHLEEGEELIECLLREVREETGIEINNKELTPFIKITYYSKNYRGSGKNRENNIYYYVINTNDNYNLDNTSYDEGEKERGYTLVKIPLKNIEKVLIDSIPDNPINEIIVEEMLEVLKEYDKIRKQKKD